MNWHKIPLTIWSKSLPRVQQLFFHAASFLSLDSEGKASFSMKKLRDLKNRIPVWRGMLLSKFSQAFARHSFRFVGAGADLASE